MTLSAEEIVDIRQMTGADIEADFSDTQIQTQYDLAAADAPNSTLVLPYTYVYVLRRLWGIQRMKADRETDYGDKETRSQIREGTKEMLDYWEGKAGLEGQGILSVGMLNLAIDTDEENMESA